MDEKDDLKRVKRVLDTWQAPAPRPALDQRVLASYRAELPRLPWWKRLLQDFSSFQPVKDWNITIETKGGTR